MCCGLYRANVVLMSHWSRGLFRSMDQAHQNMGTQISEGGVIRAQAGLGCQSCGGGFLRGTMFSECIRMRIFSDDISPSV